MTTLVLVAFLGLVAGVLSGLFGVGGGILFVPALTLGLGLTQLHAEATSLLAIIPTAVSGAAQQARFGNVRWRVAVLIGVTSIAGVEAGARIAEALPQHVLKQLFAVLLILVAAQIVHRALKRPTSGHN
jgi:uncharacterized protein